ncbi:hypothetical protein SL267_31250 [Serratia marcescens]|jgi:hypothetical protein|nr:hypothetical protein SMATCC274_31070 [Serratia marcescens]BCZ58508.1 hypothetical protein SL267_31250 [Serratia marcescens]GJK51517.1 hypothetical protein TUM17560_38940 [Serratia marcescens]
MIKRHRPADAGKASILAAKSRAWIGDAATESLTVNLALTFLMTFYASEAASELNF